MSAAADIRAEIERVVATRARLDSHDKVCNARKDARMEALLLREYHGRFLIELLQNARDAWLLAGGARGAGVLRVRVGADHTLLVGNTGAAIDANVLLYSLCKTGESTKQPGDGIGHKGVGFKSVLEVSDRPAVYSRPDGAATFSLSVQFDREAAVRTVEAASPRWHAIAAELPSHLASAHEPPRQRIPVFDFPSWCDAPPEVARFAEVGGRALNTVVALPHGAERLDTTEWSTRVRAALADLSDPVFALLDAFELAIVEDELAEGGPRVESLTAKERSSAREVRGIGIRDVEVLRNGELSSRWWIYTGRVPGSVKLDGEVVVAVRLEERDGILHPVLPSGETSAPFHLFFPTQIPTGLPFLLHGYFEVDTGRKSFAEDAPAHNAARLVALADLVLRVVEDLCAAEDAGRVDLGSLPDLFARSEAEIENIRVRDFRTDVLGRLDEVAWVRVVAGGRAAPRDLLPISEDALEALFRRAFSPRYLADRLALAYPDVGARARAWLAGRLRRDLPLRELLRPGARSPWESHIDGFPALLDLLGRLAAADPTVVTLIDGLAGDPEARVLPVLADSGVERRSPPGAPGDDEDAEEDDGRAPAWAAFARLRISDGSPLVPPACLGLEFLPDGLLDEGRVKGIGGRLGVREYVTRDILRHVGRVGTTAWTNAERAARARFLWRLLLREQQAEERVTADRFDTFEPGALAWCRPGRAGASPDERQAQARARRLARTQVPTRAGTWRPAEELAFGADWAALLGGETEASSRRARAFVDNEELAPGPDALVTDPDTLRALLPLEAGDVPWAYEHAVLGEADEPTRHALLVFLFLQRLGVWEVPPVLFHATYRDAPPKDTDRAPPGWWGAVERATDQFGERHANHRLAENARLRWPLRPGSPAQVRAIATSRALLAAHGRVVLFCNRCGWNPKHRQATNGSDAPSTLLWTLRTEPWVPVRVDGEPAPPVPPDAAWFEPGALSGPALRQSWLRFLPLADPAVDEGLARWLGCPSRNAATVAQVAQALRALRERHERGPLWRDERDRAPSRQAFVAAHVRLYELLRDRPRDQVAAIADSVGVLTEVGTRLEWVKPAHARHDHGRFTAYRRHFAGQLAFLAVPRQATWLADTLGVPRFEVTLTRVRTEGEEAEEPSTPGWLADALPELLALLAFVHVGGDPITVGSVQFLLRARRLAALRIGWVSDLIQQVSVVGRDDLKKTIGESTAGEVFLDGATSAAPVLVHDHERSDAGERLRVHLGAVVGAILESPGHADTFALYFQRADESAREGFLLEKGIGAEELAVVRQELQRAGLVAREEERRWWRAVLDQLGVTEALPGDDALVGFVRGALTRGGMSATGVEALMHAGGQADVRADTRPGGALATLEREGIALRTLHAALEALGDGGLEVGVARRRLHAWRDTFGHLVAAALHRRGRPAQAAKEAGGRWRVPDATAWRTDPPLAAVLGGVVADLRESGMEADPEHLAADAAEELAGLVGLSPDGLRAAAAELYTEEASAERARARVHRWRAALVPLLVALRTRPDDWGSRIRDEERLVLAALASPGQVAGLVDSVVGLLRDDVAAGPLAEALRAGQAEQAQPGDLLARLPTGHPDPAHLDRVRRELDVARRRRTTDLNRDRQALRDAGVAPTAPPGLGPPPGPTRTTGRREIPVGSVRRSQRRLDELGRSGERWALAALLDPVLGLGPAERRAVVDALFAALEAAYKGPAVVRLGAHAAAARASADDDDEFTLALADLAHLSATSDHFGCDALAWLAPAPDAEPRPMFVEIKSDADRSFPISVHEWAEAGRLGPAYAFLLVLRGAQADAAPKAMDLLVDPASLAGTVLALEPDGHIVRYRPRKETT
jgi:hypothetical protein